MEKENVLVNAIALVYQSRHFFYESHKKDLTID